MLKTNITNFRKNLFGMLEQTIKYNEPINIITKNGNVVVLSEEDYNSVVEAFHLCSLPQMKEAIAEGLYTSVTECIPEKEVQW